MSNIHIFEHEEFGQVRAKVVDAQPYWVAKDVCQALDITNTTDAVKRLDDDERTRLNLGRAGLANFVNEPGLYNLIMGSRKKEAKKFKRWVTHEVLPEIRNTGGYSLKEREMEQIAESEEEFNLMKDISSLEEMLEREPDNSVLQMQLQRKKDRLKDLREKQELKEKQKELEERLNSLDAVNLEGDLRQRLNQMVKKYAFISGSGFSEAWNEFKKRFNTAFRTNIELMKTNYEKDTGQEINTPGILEEKGKLEDAIRVANKMINQAS